MRERTRLSTGIEGVLGMEREASDASELIAMAEGEGDAAMVAEGVATLRGLLEEAKRQETESLLSGEADGRGRVPGDQLGGGRDGSAGLGGDAGADVYALGGAA